MNHRIIVALDFSRPEDGTALVEQLGDAIGFYKVGMSMLADGGMEFCRDLKKKWNKKVFLDLKLFDIGNTVCDAVKSLASLEVNFLTVHGDPHIVEAAVRGRGDSSTKILAVTVLTSMDRNDLDKSLYSPGNLDDIVLQRAKNALAAGADGVIASPWEVAKIRASSAAQEKLIVTPGIRPQGTSTDDQKRAATPAQAIKSGADYLVIGRAITSSSNPIQAVKNIVGSISP